MALGVVAELSGAQTVDGVYARLETMAADQPGQLSERTLWKGLPKKTPPCIHSLNNKGQETRMKNKQKWMNDTSPVVLFPLLFCLRVIFTYATLCRQRCQLENRV